MASARQCGTCMATWHVHGNVHHSSGDVIDLVVGDEISERQGVSPPSAIPDSGERTAESRVAESHISDSKSAPCDSLNTENRTLKTADEADTIGTTSNHPFWSADRQEFVQAGSLEIGERLQTLSGDVKVVQQKLPRPGPQPVFNLEVHAEHVYCVGLDGVLVHNSKVYRVLREGQSELNDLVAKAPDNMVRGSAFHVARGSNFETRFISTTRSLRRAREILSEFGGSRIVEIDLRRAPGVSNVIDVSTQPRAAGILLHPRTRNMAVKNREVLLEDTISRDALRVVE